MDTFITRMKSELKELELKLLAIEMFIDSDKVRELSESDFDLLRAQKDAMRTYRTVLDIRLKGLVRAHYDKD